MRLKILISILMLLLIITTVIAVGSMPEWDGLSIPIIETEIDDEFQWIRIPLTDISPSFADAAYRLFFSKAGYGVPEDVTVLSIVIENGLLTLDVSENILSFGGGNAFEFALTSQLLAIAAEIPEVERFSLAIEGEMRHLPEGSELIEIPLYEFLR